MKRLCIYLTYDNQNIIDEYIGYMLKELKTCVSYLVVVCNESELVRGQNILEQYADQIFYRENIGFDAGGFKDALCDYLGWDKVLEYDELVLVNDSFFGPFRPMREIFAEMHVKKVDFWGLLKHGEGIFKSGGSITAHIQSYFLVIRKRMLSDDCFRKYWEELPYYSTFNDVIDNHELKFTAYFVNQGFSYDVLADAAVNISPIIRNNYNQYGRISYELISKRNFPFLKKKPLANDALDKLTQESFRKSIDYIDKETEYDVNLIWSNLIRTMDMTDLYRSFHLRYVIPGNMEKTDEYKVLIVLFVSFMESIEYIADYISPLKGIYNIRIYSDNQEIQRYYQREGFECIECSQLQAVEIIEDFCKYDLVGIIHDVDIQSISEPNYVGKSYFYSIWENLIKNSGHIHGIIKKFQTEPWLGLLMPPAPNFGRYFSELGKGWNGKFVEVQDLIGRLNLKCQLSYLKPPIGIANNFWIRGDIFKLIKDVRKNDIDILPYTWTYIVQHAGYVSGIVESIDYASMNEVNLDKYLNRIISQVREQYQINFEKEEDFTKIIFRGALEIFSRDKNKIYIYGTGYMAQQYKDCFSHIEGYIVSDGQPKREEMDGIKIKYLSEIDAAEDVGVVLCLDKKNQAAVIPLLINKGIDNYLCI